MSSPISRRVYSCVFATVMLAGQAAPAVAADATIKVGFWNVRSGNGIAPLPGHAAPFTDSTNCTDPSQPLNAWGTGAVQAALAAGVGDPSVVALGLTESWASVCASPENIRRALGWRSASREKNGVALIARHGFAGPEQWLQLDTTLNTTPGDTMWVLRVPVCLDAACTQSMPVYVAHWYAMGLSSATSYNRQAQQTAAFLTATSGGQPHVFVGDLNVWEGGAIVCSQIPNNTALASLRGAGYMDAWLTLHGAAEGYTGMVNRAGCGYPEGYPFKRIDYAWTPSSFQPIAMQRFGIKPAGDASPSDHFGVVVTLPYPGTPPPVPDPEPAPDPAPAPPPAPTPAGAGNIVLHAKNAAIVGAAWTVVSDASAAGGARVVNADAGIPKLANPAASPASYFELPFTVEPGRAYRLWIRGRAQNDAWQNDSTFVQFSGSVTAAGGPVFRIGSSSATAVSIEEGSGAGLSGWGWQDNGYGVATLGPAIYFDAATQKVRVQVREDGLSIDQIVLSAVQFATSAPGAGKNDATILAESNPAPSPAPVTIGDIVLYAKNATAIAGAWTRVDDATAAGGVRMANWDNGLPKVTTPMAAPVSYFDLPFKAETGRAYRLWIRSRAQNDSWTNDSVYVQFSGSRAADGTPLYRMGTATAAVYSLEEASGLGESGWGWQDTGYGVNVAGAPIYFDAASQTIRIQAREDGISIDQIVLSPVTYATAAPGAARNDATILAERVIR